LTNIFVSNKVNENPVRSLIMNAILKNIATLGFIGYIPIAPGTFGSLVAFIFFYLLKPSIFSRVLILFLTIPIGIISATRAERLLNEKDSRHIVIDEFCGYFFSVLFIPLSFWYALSAFFLFRFFDILKPFPIKRIESSLKGGKGVMGDDIMAAVYTNIALRIWMLVH
jgi:phosphatidylglycerophosphatase A